MVATYLFAVEGFEMKNSLKRLGRIGRFLWGHPKFLRDNLLGAVGLKHYPPYRIPAEFRDGYSMGGTVPIVSGYLDLTKSVATRYSPARIEQSLEMVGRREVGVYQGIDRWLYEALERYPIAGKRVAVIGSADQGFGPWYECICIKFDGTPVTVEYNKITFDDDRFSMIHAEQLCDDQAKFDAAFSISSFEHDGLGRYGDPLSPDADLQAMSRWRRLIKKGGYLFLSVPIGLDKVVYNSNRIYGRRRLPLLLEGWEVVDTFGFDEKYLDRDTKRGWMPRNPDGSFLHPDYPEYSPIFVLRSATPD